MNIFTGVKIVLTYFQDKASFKNAQEQLPFQGFPSIELCAMLTSISDVIFVLVYGGKINNSSEECSD